MPVFAALPVGCEGSQFALPERDPILGEIGDAPPICGGPAGIPPRFLAPRLLASIRQPSPAPSPIGPMRVGPILASVRSILHSFVLPAELTSCPESCAFAVHVLTPRETERKRDSTPASLLRGGSAFLGRAVRRSPECPTIRMPGDTNVCVQTILVI